MNQIVRYAAADKAAGDAAPLEAVADATAAAPREAIEGPTLAPQVYDPAARAQGVRLKLADSAKRLATLVDPKWQEYLALPADVYAAGPIDAESLEAAVGRYAAVAADPRYKALAQRPEFQECLTLLQELAALHSAAGAGLELPPPPK